MLTELQTVFIYALKDPRDGAVRYIGKAKDPRRRLYLHLREAQRGENHTHKNCWVRSLLLSGENPGLEILDEVPDWQQNFFERAYIKVYREAGTKLTNLTDGGDGGATTTGRKLSPEQCAAISARNKGVPKTTEHRAALSAALIGRPVPEGKVCKGGREPGFTQSGETRHRISKNRVGKYGGEKNPMFGHTHTEESKSLMRAARLAAIERKKENVV